MNDNPTKTALIINGPPASGKSFLASKLAQDMHLPILAVDTIKEVLFDKIGIGDREYNRTLTKTCKEIIWSTISAFPDGSSVIIDAYFGLPPHDAVVRGLNKAGISRFVEIWCYAPGSVLAERYLNRVDQRHPGHPGKEYAPELIELAQKIRPLSLGPVLEVDTSGLDNISIPAITSWIEKELGQ